MPDYAEEQEESVELDWPNLQDSDEVARFVFRRRTGRPTTDEVAFREYYQQQILFPELLRRAGIGVTPGGSSGGFDESIPEGRKKTSSGLVGQLLESLGLDAIIQDLEETLGVDFGHSFALAGGIIGALLALWEAEKRIDGFPQFLHIAYIILQAISDVLYTLAHYLGKLGELDLAGTAKGIIGRFWELISGYTTEEFAEKFKGFTSVSDVIKNDPNLFFQTGLAFQQTVTGPSSPGGTIGFLFSKFLMDRIKEGW